MGRTRPTILVTGGGGRLARALFGARGRLPLETALCAVDRKELDITNLRQIEKALAGFRPSVVINAAGFTNVDKAEAEREAAFAANVTGPKLLARGCANFGAALIHISTDFVFDGSADAPYSEFATPNPLGWYGRTKADGEEAVLNQGGRAAIARVAWLCGDNADFPTRMFLLGRARGGVTVAADEVGCPTPLGPLAEKLLKLAQMMQDGTPVPEVLHLVGQPPTSRYDWVRAAFDAADRLGVETPPLQPARGADFNLPAKRPPMSALDVTHTERLLGPAPDWRIGLGERLAAAANA